MKFTKSILLAAAAVVMPLVSHAAVITSNPTINIGSLTFSNFTCVLNASGTMTTGDCGSVQVSPITTPGTGIQFSSSFTALSFGTTQTDDVTLGYQLAVSGAGVNSVGLSFNGSFYGYAISQVTETVWSGTTELGQLTVNCSTVNCSDLNTAINLGAYYNNLTITKDINVTAYPVNTGSQATISWINQTFSPVATPEPASTALMGAGLTLAAFFMRRKLSNN